MDRAEQQLLIDLITKRRWAALATVDNDGAPHASMVAYVPDADGFGLLLHLSRLSRHTRNLFANPAASLVIGEPDNFTQDPQKLARVTLTGAVTASLRDSEAWIQGKARYLERLPEAEQLFGFKDFTLFRFEPRKARHIGGFARAFSLGAEQLREVLVSGGAAVLPAADRGDAQPEADRGDD